MKYYFEIPESPYYPHSVGISDKKKVYRYYVNKDDVGCEFIFVPRFGKIYVETTQKFNPSAKAYEVKKHAIMDDIEYIHRPNIFVQC